MTPSGKHLMWYEAGFFFGRNLMRTASEKMVEVFSDSCRVQSSRTKNDLSSRALPAAQA